MSSQPRGEHRGGRGGPRGGGRGGGRGNHEGGRGGHVNAGGERERPKKENILDLGKYMDKQITVKFTGGREGLFSLAKFGRVERRGGEGEGGRERGEERANMEWEYYSDGNVKRVRCIDEFGAG
jgi:hypothetical protein